MSRCIHAWHFGGLAADQSAAGLTAALGNARDDGRGGVHIKLAAGEVIEEEQRFGTADQDVVDAHGDQIDAHRVMPVQRSREEQLRADTVRARDQHRVAEAVAELKQATESAQAGQDFRAPGRCHERFDSLDQRIPRVNIDARISIVHGRAGWLVIHFSACNGGLTVYCDRFAQVRKEVVSFWR